MKVREMSDGLAPHLPKKWYHALGRGFSGRCPACGKAPLFRAFLKNVDVCPRCGQRWDLHEADDLPPYLVILLLGHIVVPTVASMEMAFDPPIWVAMSITLPLTVGLAIGLIQPVKGAVIAYQWWHRLQGFANPPQR
jgi:uncharacterized protein (DUF983 family)